MYSWRRLDYTENPDVSNFYSDNPKKSVALLGNYDSHFVPVRDYGQPYDFQACDESEATGHELISQNFLQLCPIAIVYFQ